MRVTYKELNEFSQRLTDWYDGEGGLFFSQTSTLQYFDIQIMIGIIIRRVLTRGMGVKEDEIVPEETVQIISSEVGKLRSALAKDIGTRRTTRLREFFRVGDV